MVCDLVEERPVRELRAGVQERPRRGNDAAELREGEEATKLVGGDGSHFIGHVASVFRAVHPCNHAHSTHCPKPLPWDAREG